MAIDDFGVAKALTDQLLALAPSGLPVVTQGKTGPTGNSRYLRTWVMPASANPQDLQTGVRQNGIFQIDVMTPKKNGTWFNLETVGLIKNIFVPAQTYTHNGQAVKVISVGASRLQDDGAYWVTYLSVTFVSFG